MNSILNGIKFNKGDLKRHFSNSNCGNQPFRCSMCRTTFAKNSQMVKHIETVHLKNKRQKISCKLCDIDFKRVHSLNRHNASVHEGNECSICHVTYTFRDDLIHHIRTKHDKVHECKVCSFKFGDSESLLKHIDVIHEGKKLHQCTKCGYTFRNEVRNTIFKFYSKVFLFE